MKRSSRLELIDAADAPPSELCGALCEIELINRALGGYRPSLEGVERLLPSGVRGFSILDVGCGCGDVMRRLVDWARRRRLHIRAVAIELSEAAVALARAECADYPEIHVERRNLFDLDADRRFDIVHTSMMLHHMPDAAAVRRALVKMGQLGRMGIVINDLHRHWMAWLGIHGLTRALSRNAFIRHDAPLSVARGFVRHELLAAVRGAGFPRALIAWHWPFRWLVTIPLADCSDRVGQAD
ncbi:MAG: class I SAM-dependent methyltransferase [Candidatus Sumerlaeia bacterium]